MVATSQFIYKARLVQRKRRRTKITLRWKKEQKINREFNAFRCLLRDLISQECDCSEIEKRKEWEKREKSAI